MSYSKALCLKYNYFPNLDQLVFEDGVCYTTEEAVLMAKMSGEAIRAVHLIKQMFGGQVLRESEGKKEEALAPCWFETVPSVKEEDIVSIVPKKKPVLPPDAEPIRMDL